MGADRIARIFFLYKGPIDDYIRAARKPKSCNTWVRLEEPVIAC